MMQDTRAILAMLLLAAVAVSAYAIIIGSHIHGGVWR